MQPAWWIYGPSPPILRHLQVVGHLGRKGSTDFEPLPCNFTASFKSQLESLEYTPLSGHKSWLTGLESKQTLGDLRTHRAIIQNTSSNRHHPMTGRRMPTSLVRKWGYLPTIPQYRLHQGNYQLVGFHQLWSYTHAYQRCANNHSGFDDKP